MKNLNITTFNEVLLKAALGDKERLEILKAEADMGTALYFEAVHDLLDELVNYGYKSDKFTLVNNIAENLNTILEMIEDLAPFEEVGEDEKED